MVLYSQSQVVVFCVTPCGFVKGFKRHSFPGDWLVKPWGLEMYFNRSFMPERRVNLTLLNASISLLVT